MTEPAAPAHLGPFKVSKHREGGTAAEAAAHPSQEHLRALVSAHRDTLRSISISAEYDDKSERLNFGDIGVLPNLTDLTLRCVAAPQLRFTTKNLPALEHLTAENMIDSVNFYLDLPELRSLDIQHTHADASPNNAFGASLSRCPKLESVYTYKFRFLAGSNFCVLPECHSLCLWRSECTQRLEILHAPHLSTLDLQAAYDLQHVRLWDLPAATREDALALCRRERNRMKESVRDTVLAAIRARPAPEGAQAPCECSVQTTNMDLSDASKVHLLHNSRVVIETEDSDDDYANCACCGGRERMMGQILGLYS